MVFSYFKKIEKNNERIEDCFCHENPKYLVGKIEQILFLSDFKIFIFGICLIFVGLILANLQREWDFLLAESLC